MKHLICLALATLLIATATPALATATVGDPAPAFAATDSNGNPVALEDYKGKVVILEWTNNGCPFVKKHYESGNMQKTQKAATDGGAIWLTVISSAEGKQGHVSGEEANALTQERNALPTAVLLDTSGEVGRLYEAKTTPHMFVIDSNGTLVYAGAIDSIPSVDKNDVVQAENYVLSALDNLKNGEPVKTPSTRAYGCDVKY